MKQFLLITGWEIFRMFARRRTYIGYASFATFSIFFYFLFSQPGPQRMFRMPLERAGYLFDDYFSGLTVAIVILSATTVLLTILFFPLVAGDIVAKESEDGNLRLVLSRPVSRFKLLLSKFCACQVYTLSLVLFVGVFAYLTGSLLADWNGGLFLMIPHTGLFSLFDFPTGIQRYSLGCVMIGLSMTTVSSIAFLFSCQRIKPAAATITAIVIVISDFIFSGIPSFKEFQPWFLAPRLASWQSVFRERILWPDLIENYAILFGISITCFVIAWITFERRDLKA